jgi:hypothetical protein
MTLREAIDKAMAPEGAPARDGAPHAMTMRASYNDPHPDMQHIGCERRELLWLTGNSITNQIAGFSWTGTANVAQWALLLDFLAPPPLPWWRRAWDRLVRAVRP